MSALAAAIWSRRARSVSPSCRAPGEELRLRSRCRARRGRRRTRAGCRRTSRRDLRAARRPSPRRRPSLRRAGDRRRSTFRTRSCRARRPRTARSPTSSRSARLRTAPRRSPRGSRASGRARAAAPDSPAGIARNPPSPCTGSRTTHATVDGSTSALNRCSSAAIESSEEMPWYGYGAGARYTSGANGPNPALYGLTLLVIVIASSVRPWNALSKTIDRRAAGRRARDLDGVLDRLGARVHEDRALLSAAARRQLGKPAADLDVRLVDADHEALVQVPICLLLDRLDDRGMPVARVLAADPAREVDVGAPVRVGDARALGVRDDELRRRHARRDVARAVGEDPLRRCRVSRLHRGIIGSAHALRQLAGRAPRRRNL